MELKMSVPLSLNVLHTTAELETLVPEWRNLWLQDPNATPFQRPEWLVPWWHRFGQPDLYVLAFRHAGLLTGLLPLYVFADQARQERQLLLLGAGTSDYLDGILSPTCTRADVIEGFTLLAGEATWEIAHLTQLRPHSPLYKALSVQDGNTIRIYPGENCSRFAASSIADLPKKVRAAVRYCRNLATNRGTLKLQVADARSWPRYFDELIRQHSARWNEAGQPGVLANPQVLAWHREMLPHLLQEDALRLYCLSLDDVAIATLYALIDPPSRANRTEYFYLSSYSRAHSELKPGTLLRAMAIEHAATEGVVMIDMLRGKEAYKKLWRVQDAPTFGLSFSRLAVANLS
jgi:CelD/BcsL family acetyltransferase involved in cellulose biosynthesis